MIEKYELNECETQNIIKLGKKIIKEFEKKPSFTTDSLIREVQKQKLSEYEKLILLVGLIRWELMKVISGVYK